VDNVALSAASMGGILIGGAITRFPRHMGAAVIQVGMLNPIRLLESPNGANQIAEVGDPRTEAGMKALAAMDPYQHIRAGTAYPAVLLSVGLNDSRVSTWESGKFAAGLRVARSNRRPVWIRTDAAAGHGADSMDAEALEYADIYAFLDDQLPGRSHGGDAKPESATDEAAARHND
jgi:prolyl oligopeptidase